jgi:hypothetical protein
MSTVLAATALLIGAIGFVWQSRARAHRRNAALDAYADREIVRARSKRFRARQRMAVAGARRGR